MKYESELLSQIIADRGHEKSSTHYESECMETFIKEYDDGYPKLCDYEGEWLNYIVENPIGVFPYETITDVTEATINNVVPFEFKSAILKGRTLVNISSLSGEITIKPGSNKFIDSPLIKQNTTYTFMFNCTSAPSTGFIEIRQMFGNTTLKIENINVVQGYNKFKLTTVNKEVDRFRLKNESTSETDFVFNNLLIIEGDYTNADIPYFTGMQSVKLPVLTTTGKNLFNNNYTIGKFFDEMGIDSDGTNTQCALTEFMPIKGGVNVKLSNSITLNGVMIFEYDANKKFLAKTWAEQLRKTQDNTRYYRYRANLIGGGSSSEEALKVMMMEYGTQSSLYEPYKSNILTVNEPVELRGVGDVKDELDCLTGELTQRVGEIVLDGSELWNEYTSQELTNTRLFYCEVPTNSNINTSKFTMINNRFASLDPNAGGLWNTDVVGLGCGVVKNAFRLRVLKSTANTISELKEYLHSNPIVVQYELAEKSIKTVDLTITNQDGQTVSKLKPIEGTMHMETNGEPLKPLLSAEVPVEAITQNLNSFIEGD